MFKFDAKKFQEEAMKEVKRSFKQESAQMYFDAIKSEIATLISDANLQSNQGDSVDYIMEITDLNKSGLETDAEKFLALMQSEFPEYKIIMNEETDRIKYSIFYKE